MKKREILEWLSLAPADFPCWLAILALVGMWYANTLFLASAFGFGAVISSLIACYYGMPANIGFSRATNASKLILYPLFAVMTVIAVGVIYVVQHSS